MDPSTIIATDAARSILRHFVEARSSNWSPMSLKSLTDSLRSIADLTFYNNKVDESEPLIDRHREAFYSCPGFMNTLLAIILEVPLAKYVLFENGRAARARRGAAAKACE